jgi:anaerobic glycerol-3-phosphate dehydrogenase
MCGIAGGFVFKEAGEKYNLIYRKQSAVHLSLL